MNKLFEKFEEFFMELQDEHYGYYMNPDKL